MDTAKADELLLALVSAYVWVASADRGVVESERAKFEHVITESPFATQFDQAHLRPYFKDMVAAYEDDFEGAMALTKVRLARLRGQDHLIEEVLRVSRAAITGDAHLADSEEVALAAISQVLGFG